MERADAEGERPAGVRRSARFSPELEALRGVAALLVVVYHAHSLVRPGERPVAAGPLAPLRAFAEEGHTGVTLFFVLSAFLLSQPFLVGARRGKTPSLRRFFERRALRILPLYFVAVAVATGMLAEAPADLLVGLPYLVFLNSHGPWVTSLFPYSTAWWSLATEAQFYVVLPLGGWLATTRAGRFALTALVGAGLAAFAVFAAQWLVMPSMAAQYSLLLSIVGRGPIFLCGVGAAWLWVWHGSRLRAEAERVAWLRRGGADGALLALLFVLGLLLIRAGDLGFFVAEVNWAVWHVYEGLLWAGVVLAVMLLPLRSRPLLARGPLVWLGTISYSVYIWHYPILHGLLRPLWTESGGPGWTVRGSGFALLGFAATAAVSTLSYRFVERPFLVRKARIEG